MTPRIAAFLLAIVLPFQGSVAANAASAAATSTTGRYTGYGFDTCAAPSSNTLLEWRADPTMPYGAVNAYVGGVNRHCAQTELTADWVSAVEAQGWVVVPTYIGLQAPCADNQSLTKISANAAAAQGTAAARDAVVQAEALGIGVGVPIFGDMESYDRNDTACVAVVTQFLTAWTRELHALGFLSGVYGGSYSTIHDLDAGYGAPGTAPPDAIWFAHWNGDPTLSDPTYFSDAHWTNHQRMHQYVGEVDETYGGVKLHIDKDYLDVAVADGSTATADDTNPTGAMSKPAAGSTVHPGSQVVVAGNFSDDTAVDHVDFFVSTTTTGTPLWRRIGTATPSVTGHAALPWTEKYAAGSTLRFRGVAFDTSGRVDPIPRSTGSIRVTLATRLSIAVSDAHVRAGAPVTVTARLLRTDTGQGLAHRTVALQRRRHGTTSWFGAGNYVTDGTGRVHLLLHPTRSTDLRARYAGSTTFDAAVSAVTSVYVRAG